MYFRTSHAGLQYRRGTTLSSKSETSKRWLTGGRRSTILHEIEISARQLVECDASYFEFGNRGTGNVRINTNRASHNGGRSRGHARSRRELCREVLLVLLGSGCYRHRLGRAVQGRRTGAAYNRVLQNQRDSLLRSVPPSTNILSSSNELSDETVGLLLVLKAPWQEETVLRSRLERLAISIEAHIVNGSVPDGPSPPVTELIFKGSVPDVADPFIIVDEEEAGDSEGETHQCIYAIWKLPVLLPRPRMRLQSPTIIFTASAGLKPDESTDLAPNGQRYLPSGVPSGLNLLESFTHDPSLNDVKPRLSALRVSRVVPLTQQEGVEQRIRTLPQLKFQIFPAINSRIRFSRPNTEPVSSAVIAILEVDFTSYFESEFLLNKIELSVPGGEVQCLNGDALMQPPLSCVAHDHITFLYHVIPRQYDLNHSNHTRELKISIVATAQLIPDVCTPQLTMNWSTPIDFTLPVNPGFGATPGPSLTIQRSHRPSQLSISSGQVGTPLKSPVILRPDALPTLEAATSRTETALPELGITMSFSAPSEPVRLGDIFCWTVYVVNRPSEQKNQHPRKLALVSLPKRQRQEVRSLRPISSSRKKHAERDIADAALDDNVLHAMQKNAAVGTAEVACLSADTRVGPLAPGACHVVELQFLALKEGIIGIEAIRVVDMSTQEHVDVRDLPTMVVEPAAA